MSKKQRVSSFGRKLAMVIAMALILLFWQAAAWTLPDFLMPGVPTVALRLWHDIQTEEFRQVLSGSLGRLGMGYLFALLFGIGFGLLGGVLMFFREILKSAIIILQSIPSIA